MQPPIKVLIVDDHPLFRRGLVAVLEDDRRIEVVGEARDGMAAIARAEKLPPSGSWTFPC